MKTKLQYNKLLVLYIYNFYWENLNVYNENLTKKRTIAPSVDGFIILFIGENLFTTLEGIPGIKSLFVNPLLASNTTTSGHT